jgi:hypothetical protein
MRTLVWIVPLSLVACAAPASQSTTPLTPAGDQGSSTFQRALEIARSKRAALSASSPPAYAGDGSKAAALEYNQGPLTRWVQRIKGQLADMNAAYSEASGAASSPDLEIDLLVEALDVAEALTRKFVAAGDRSVPLEWSQLKSVGLDVAAEYHKRMERAALDGLERQTLERCVERADEQAVRSPAAERCRASLARVKAALAEDARSPPTQDETAPPPPPAWVDTKESGGCVFAGSLRPGSSSLTLDEAGTTRVATLDGGSMLVVEHLELPRDASGRTKVVLSYPIVGTAWLDPAARPLALPKRIDVVPDHVWIEAGAPMNARLMDAGHAKLSLSLASRAADPPPPGPTATVTTWGAPAIQVRPATASQVVACVGLKLYGSQRTEVPRSKSALRELPGDHWVPLFGDAKGTREVARLRGPTGLDELAQADGFAHVAFHGSDVSFEGWVRASDVPPPSTDAFGMIGLIRHMGGAAYRAHKGTAVAVRLAADPGAPVEFTLSPDATVFLGTPVGDFDEVLIGEFAEGTRYFVSRGAVEQVR